MRGIVTVLVILMALQSGAEDRLLPLAKYEVKRITQAIEAEIDRATSALQGTTLSPDEARAIQQYIRDLSTQLQAVNDTPIDTLPPVMVIAQGVVTAQYPSVGALITNGETVCSGTMIDSQTFLTAKHCFEASVNPYHYAVHLQNAGIKTLSAIDLHPQDDVDLALVTLQHSLTGISPSAIPLTVTTLNELRQIVGFGITMPNASDSGIKRHGGITTASCPTGFAGFICWEFDPITSLSKPESNVCSRDSGGPVGRTEGGELKYEDAVAVRIGPELDCQAATVSLSLGLNQFQAWFLSRPGGSLEGEASGESECGKEGIDDWVGDGTVPTAGGIAYEDWTFDVDSRFRTVRVTLNAFDVPLSDLELSVWAVAPLPAPVECKDLGRYESCEYQFNDAPPGTWAARVESIAGTEVFYQLVVTKLEPACAK